MLAEIRLTLTPDYLPAARVALTSFLTWHPAFAGHGHIVVLAEAGHLPCLRAGLDDLPGLSLRPLSTEMLAAAAPFTPALGWATPRLHGLELWRQPCDGHVLILDADLLFTGPLDIAAWPPDRLLASAEGAHYRGMQVERGSNRMVPPVADDPGLITRTFNSGLVVVPPGLLGEATFREALGILASPGFAGQSRRQHDQFVLNRLFEGRWHDLGPASNYLLRHAEAIFEATGLRLSEARVVHFNEDPRPWQLADLAGCDDPRLLAAASQWLRAHVDDVARRAVSVLGSE